MFDIPYYVWPFVLAVIAAIGARMVSGRVRDDPGSLPGWILYAVAIGFAIIGIATWWLSQQV